MLCRGVMLPRGTDSPGHDAPVHLTLRTIWKLTLPNRFLSASCDDAPETASDVGGTIQHRTGC